MIMPRNEKFLEMLKAPEGRLDTTIADATGPFIRVCGLLGLAVDHLQGNPEVQGPGSAPFVTIQDMLDAGAIPGGPDADQLYIEGVIPPQTGGIDVGQTLANIRSSWLDGVEQLMTDVFETPQSSEALALNAFSRIPAVRQAALTAVTAAVTL